MTPQTTQTESTMQNILLARARALAVASQSEAQTEGRGVVVLALGQERYGVDIMHVQEIRPLAGVTFAPGAPAFWRGLINLRGRLYPVLDLRSYLGLPAQDAKADSQVALVSAAGLEVCLQVDDVLGVRYLAPSEIGPALAEAAHVRRELVSGVTHDLLAVLDLEMLLADSQLVVQDEAN